MSRSTQGTITQLDTTQEPDAAKFTSRGPVAQQAAARLFEGTMNKVTFVILSFEGPDPYSRAGGLASRVTELSTALASMGLETHLFFVGDPGLPGHEVANDGRLHLHRWCQWISRYHPSGVYEEEEGKLFDWDRSLPAWMESDLLRPKVEAGCPVVVLGEEWHTAGTITRLRQIVDRRGWHDRVFLLWNANNTFSFHRIDWGALKRAAAITTVSRYMKHVMWRYGVDARVVPNGISERWLVPVDQRASMALSRLFRNRVVLVKVARWDPDKRWLMAVDAVAEMKRLGLRPLFLARGGIEAHGREVLDRAGQRGLVVAKVRWTGNSPDAMAQALQSVLGSDMVIMENYLDEGQRRLLFHVADGVLANSGIEPFGLVGLEAMAAGGVAFVGCTGEDYVTPGYDAIALQTSDPWEIVKHVVRLRTFPHEQGRLRRAARVSAARHTWTSVIRRLLLPTLEQMGLHIGIPDNIYERGGMAVRGEERYRVWSDKLGEVVSDPQAALGKARNMGYHELHGWIRELWHARNQIKQGQLHPAVSRRPTAREVACAEEAWSVLQQMRRVLDEKRPDVQGRRRASEPAVVS